MPRYGKLQVYRPRLAQKGVVARIYGRIFGTTNLFSLGCFPLFKRAIRNLELGVVLEGGCGQGDTAFYLAEAYPSIQIDAWDYGEGKYKSNIDICRSLQKLTGINNLNFVRANLLDLDAINQYDFIYSIHVLEHIEDNQRVVSNFYSALKNGGHLYIQMPGESGFRMKPLQKYLKNRYQWEKREHISLCSLRELTYKLRKAGFDIVFARAETGILFSLAWQTREALVENSKLVLGAFLLPFLKALVLLDRFLKDRIPSAYGSVARFFISDFDLFEDNIEALARKAVSS